MPKNGIWTQIIGIYWSRASLQNIYGCEKLALQLRLKVKVETNLLRICHAIWPHIKNDF